MEGLKIRGCPYVCIHLLALLARLALTSCAYSRAFLCLTLKHHLGIIIIFFPPNLTACGIFLPTPGIEPNCPWQ